MRVFPIHPEWPQILRGVLSRAVTLQRQAVLAFDLDSTLFDNRPRQARIVREYGAAHGLPALTRCTPEDFVTGWDLRGPLGRCGLSEAAAERVYPELKKFWQARFFTSPYCTDDTEVEGAASFAQAVAKSGAWLCYVTGRHEGMREGTVEAMRQTGMPLPGDNVVLMMKPTENENDDAFKRQAHEALGRMGMLIAAFDNEPTHANDYRRKFPEAIIIHLGTDHSDRPVDLLAGVVTVPHFSFE